MKKTGFILAGCLAFTASGISSGEPYSIGQPGAAWRDSELKLCWQSDMSSFQKDVKDWADHPFSSTVPDLETQTLVQSWVESTYARDRVGIGFSGFRECPTDKNLLKEYTGYLAWDLTFTSNLNSIPGKTLGGISVIGDRNRYEDPGILSRYTLTSSKVQSSWPEVKLEKTKKKAGVGFHFSDVDSYYDQLFHVFLTRIELLMFFSPKTIDPDTIQAAVRKAAHEETALMVSDSKKFKTLHEFGHLLGLLHEDRRKDAKENRPNYCGNIAGDDGKQGTENLGSPESTFGTAYDPFSVMSYCRESQHYIFHKARLFCQVSEYFEKPLKVRFEAVLKYCPEISKIEFPVDLTKRDVTALRKMYLGESPKKDDDSVDFKKSPSESRLAEILQAVSEIL